MWHGVKGATTRTNIVLELVGRGVGVGMDTNGVVVACAVVTWLPRLTCPRRRPRPRYVSLWIKCLPMAAETGKHRWAQGCRSGFQWPYKGTKRTESARGKSTGTSPWDFSPNVRELGVLKAKRSEVDNRRGRDRLLTGIPPSTMRNCGECASIS